MQAACRNRASTVSDRGGRYEVICRTGSPTIADGCPQMENKMAQSEVLIVGAGPTGLVLALWLTKLGVKVRIIDKTAEPGTTSRALAVQARTLELYRQLDLADFVIAHGHQVPAVNLWVKGEPAARLPFETIGEGLTAYPFLEIFPQ